MNANLHLQSHCVPKLFNLLGFIDAAATLVTFIEKGTVKLLLCGRVLLNIIMFLQR